MALTDFYDLDKSIKSFAVSNDFVMELNKVCYKLGQQLQPFSFMSCKEQQEYGVLDFATFQGFFDQNKTLVREIADYRRDVYASMNMRFDSSNPEMAKLLFFDYLMTISICYVEIPKYVTKDNIPQRSFDKFLVTKNPAIMATWMGCQPSEMQAKYSSKIISREVEFINNEIRAVKLTSSGKGNSIVCPRNSLAVDKMTCTPLFMIYAFIRGTEESLRNGILKFTYLKDNNTIRELPTTLNSSILMDYYNDQQFVEMMLNGTDIFSNQQGGMLLSSKQARGYVKLPEIGSSKYDATGVRALNLSRILRIEKITEVDRTFINVDLSSCVPNFHDCVDYALQKMQTLLPVMYKMMTGEDVKPEQSQPSQIAQLLKDYATTRNTVLSTTFQRQLHLFMVNNPQWFPKYTGKPNGSVVSSQNFGVSSMDF